MDFPALVYRCPGPHIGPQGTTYGAELVRNEAEFAAALSAGLFATLPAAVEAFLSPPQAVPELQAIPDDDAPPTREELEKEAERLGIRVDRRWGDKRLLDEIEKAHK